MLRPAQVSRVVRGRLRAGAGDVPVGEGRGAGDADHDLPVGPGLGRENSRQFVPVPAAFPASAVGGPGAEHAQEHRRQDVAEERHTEALFVPLDEALQRATREILAAHPKLMGRGGGRNAADPFFIGLAMARAGVVVTEETMSGNLDTKPRIPDVCQALGCRGPTSSASSDSRATRTERALGLSGLDLPFATESICAGRTNCPDRSVWLG